MRSIDDTSLKVKGTAAQKWMAIEQCFAGILKTHQKKDRSLFEISNIVNDSLDNLYDNPYCDRFLFRPLVPCHINGLTLPKLQAPVRRDIPVLTLY